MTIVALCFEFAPSFVQYISNCYNETALHFWKGLCIKFPHYVSFGFASSHNDTINTNNVTRVQVAAPFFQKKGPAISFYPNLHIRIVVTQYTPSFDLVSGKFHIGHSTETHGAIWFAANFCHITILHCNYSHNLCVICEMEPLVNRRNYN